MDFAMEFKLGHPQAVIDNIPNYEYIQTLTCTSQGLRFIAEMERKVEY